MTTERADTIFASLPHRILPQFLFLALQPKARYEGVPTPVYGLPEVHHLS